jgi:hypothetical protein
MVDATDAMLERWEQYALSGGEFDLSAETSRLALDVIGRTLLGDDLRDEAESLGRAVDIFGVLFSLSAASDSPSIAISRICRDVGAGATHRGNTMDTYAAASVMQDGYRQSSST